MPLPCFVNVHGKIYGNSPEGWVHMEKKNEKPLTYAELVKMANTMPEIPPEIKAAMEKMEKNLAKKKYKKGSEDTKAEPEQT